MSSIQAEDSDSESEPQFSPANGSIRNEPLTYHSPQHQTILSAGSSGAGSPLREPLDPPPLSGREKETEDTEEDYLFGVEELAKKTKKKRWMSIYVIFFTMFLSAVTFSIALSSIWPYLLEVDYKNASAKFLGWVVAAYSFGQLLASPFFGFWADKRPAREPLIVALLINVIFSVLYSYCGAFQSGVAGWIMLVSRAMVGFGAGIAAVVRSYVSEATTEKERTGALAGVSSAQAIGFILGPALGLAFVPLGYEGLKIDAIKFKFNMYTGPGYLSALLGVVNIILLILIFHDYKLTKHKQSEKMTKPVNCSDSFNSASSSQKMPRLLAGSFCCPSASFTSTDVYSSISTSMTTSTRKPYDRLGAIICIFIFFVVLFVFAVFETLGSPLSMDEFAWTKKEAVLYNNLFYVGMALLAILTFIVIKFVTKKVDERVVLMMSLFIVAFGYFAMLPMSNDPPQVTLSNLDASNRTRNHSEGWIPEAAGNQTLEVVGCRDPPQTWCSHVGRIYLFQYGIAMILLAVGYPAANLITYAIFSKILGPFPQGTMMGFLTAAGSLARAMGPLLITILYQHKGPAITFPTVVGVIGVSIIVLLLFCRRLVPYRPGSGYRTIN